MKTLYSNSFACRNVFNCFLCRKGTTPPPILSRLEPHYIAVLSQKGPALAKALGAFGRNTRDDVLLGVKVFHHLDCRNPTESVGSEVG